MSTLRAFPLLLLPLILVAACDGGGDTSTGGGGSGGGSTGGGGDTSSSGGSGGTGGTGGSAQGGGGTGGTGGSAQGGGGTGGMTGGACLNPEDGAVLNDPNKDVPAAVGKCGQDNFGMEPATLDCIKMTGLSDGCAQCFDDTVHCIIEKCLSECIADAGSQACVDCRKMNCDPAFAECSGLMP
ncbi:MAG: hypothetical protein R3F14_27185 [Polyangiaceae bacterium]